MTCSKTRFFGLIAIVIATTATAGPALGGAIIQSFTGGRVFANFWQNDDGVTGDTIGMQFTANESGYFTKLGVVNDPSRGGVLDAPHQVGLWDSNQNLLASAIVDSSGELIDGFYYVDIDPVEIIAGQRYTLGAVYARFDSDDYISSLSADDVELKYISDTVGVRPAEQNLGFAYPTAQSPSTLIRIGPNAYFQSSITTTPVIPTPSAALGGLVCLGLFTMRRRA